VAALFRRGLTFARQHPSGYRLQVGRPVTDDSGPRQCPVNSGYVANRANRSADRARLAALICRRSVRAFGARSSSADRQLWHHPTRGKGARRRRTGRASLHVRRRGVPDGDAPGALDRRHTVNVLAAAAANGQEADLAARGEASSSGASTALSKRFSHRPIWPRLSRAAGCAPPIRMTPGLPRRRAGGCRRLGPGPPAFRVHPRKGGRGVRGRVGPLLPSPSPYA
jgi:hypothetical protein